ncbi:hypothetical protein PVAND_003549 [Polypedilum vanderplanki]|uniref:Uncharacterized protein n=1 Tax=Polypedilum vanderplanki TaxID=319348 RepID=A0A9J6BUE0_POLVA|nr:hypothetical protein PVAND_003549 [Polypedilum vanderplanki]
MLKSVQMIVIIMILLLHKNVSGKIYCGNHNYDNSYNTGHMQFTKEVVDEDYVMMDNFKYLHCCAKGYRSIEWLKDGKTLSMVTRGNFITHSLSRGS